MCARRNVRHFAQPSSLRYAETDSTLFRATDSKAVSDGLLRVIGSRFPNVAVRQRSRVRLPEPSAGSTKCIRVRSTLTCRPARPKISSVIAAFAGQYLRTVVRSRLQRECPRKKAGARYHWVDRERQYALLYGRAHRAHSARN